MYMGFTVEKVLALPLTAKAGPLDARPFPGRYPTRVFYQISWLEGVKIRRETYLGKPSMTVWNRLRKIYHSPVCDFQFMEFDMAQQVWYGGNVQRRWNPIAEGRFMYDTIPVQRWNNELARYYRPTMTNAQLHLGPSVLFKWRTEQDKLGIARVYMPADGKQNGSVRRAWREWLGSPTKSRISISAGTSWRFNWSTGQ